MLTFLLTRQYSYIADPPQDLRFGGKGYDTLELIKVDRRAFVALYYGQPAAFVRSGGWFSGKAATVHTLRWDGKWWRFAGRERLSSFGRRKYDDLRRGGRPLADIFKVNERTSA